MNLGDDGVVSKLRKLLVEAVKAIEGKCVCDAHSNQSGRGFALCRRFYCLVAPQSAQHCPEVPTENLLLIHLWFTWTFFLSLTHAFLPFSTIWGESQTAE